MSDYKIAYTRTMLMRDKETNEALIETDRMVEVAPHQFVNVKALRDIDAMRKGEIERNPITRKKNTPSATEGSPSERESKATAKGAPGPVVEKAAA